MDEKIPEQRIAIFPNIDLETQGLKLSEKELIIYEGLKIFRPDIAAFYKDGLEIKRLNIESKSNVLAHLLREIDGGLRDVFDKGAEVIEKKCLKCGKVEKSIQNNPFRKNARNLYNEFKVQYSELDYLKDISFDKFNKHSGHVYSILSSMQLSINEPVAKEYIMVAIWFHKYAHRESKSISSPRTENDIIKMWNKFESVLYELLRNYRQYDQADAILSISQPVAEDIQKLKIIERAEATKIYFWRSLLHAGWLEPLYKEGYFAGDKNRASIFDEESNGFKVLPWIELFYVQNMAYQMSQCADSDFTIILNIIDDICTYRKPNGTRVNNQITDSAVISVISTLPADVIHKKHFEYITRIFKSNNRGQQDGYDFQRTFIDRFIQANDKQNLLRCLSIVLLF